MAKSLSKATIRVWAVVALFVGLCFGTARAEAFLSVLDDMPLAPGLTELTDQAAEFETPEGRIVDATAEGKLDAGGVLAFYDKTLPSLGWRREGAGRFTRDRERLTITVAKVSLPAGGKGLAKVRFSLRPRP